MTAAGLVLGYAIPHYIVPAIPTIQQAIKDDKALARLVKAVGVKEAMARLVVESNAGVAFDCHQPAHKIGRMGYDKQKQDAFRECNADCHSGCYHGAMESFLSEKGIDNLAKDIDEVCNIFETGFGKFECLHGVGHGVLALLDYDLPGALKECQKLSDFFAQSSCYGGAFMENIIAAQGLGAEGPHSTTWVKDGDPHFPCNAIGPDQGMRYQCYQMQTSWMLYKNGNDFRKAAAECLKAPAGLISVCFKSLGRDAAGQTVRDSEKMLAFCAYAKHPDTDYYKQCISGAMNVIVDFWGPRLKGQAAGFCAVVPDAAVKNSCYAELAGRIQHLYSSPEDQQASCAAFPAYYRHLCEIKPS